MRVVRVVWITAVLFIKNGSAQTDDVTQPNPLIAAEVGQNVTLHCVRLQEDTSGSFVWYQQQVGHKPRVIGSVQHDSPSYENEFKPPRFSIGKEKRSCDLRIASVEASDEAMYYCGYRKFLTRFGNGTFLAVKDDGDVKVSVSQSSVSDSVPAGASVTLQCSVLSESRAAELQVLWFRAAPPQSHPQIIYTHHNSGHQCESGSCVYNFSKNILSHNDTGTYYCAVAACGKIIIGNGTRVQLESSGDPVMISLAVALGVCVVVIIALIFVLTRETGNREQRMAGSTHAKKQPVPVITARIGDDVILHCFRPGEDNTDDIAWYKQEVGHKPRVMVTVQQKAKYEEEFNTTRFSIEKDKISCHLKISNVQQSDEAMYHCGFREFFTRFGNGTFLSVTVSLKQGSVIDKTLNQDCDNMEMNYAALHFTDSTHAKKQPVPVITARIGDDVILHCFRPREDNTDDIVWYKQEVGHKPRVMVTVQQKAKYKEEFNSTRFSIEKEKMSCHLKISNVQQSDEAMYHCGFREFVTWFGNGTFLAVTGEEDVKVSVSQSGVSDSVPAGASVTLQCSVLSESRAAELQVLWFRAAPPQSHPQIIYTHHNSGHQCESGSPTHTCVYNFSKNILSLSDTGTYYCAVAACGRIIIGNGTRVQLERSVDPVVICLALALGVCVVVIFALMFVVTRKDRNIMRLKQGSVMEKNLNQDCDNMEMNYAALHFRQDNTNTMFWYKQKVGHRPRIIVTVQQESIFEGEFKSPRFSIEKEKSSCHLKISTVEPSDEAMYYCGFRQFFTKFGNGTFLSVNGKPDVKVSVSQSGVSDSVPAGASVTLQCSVLSESRAAELQVLWFRAAPPQSHPQIIYTHHNSSHQCESGSPTHTCVYNFSKNILSLSDTGTYYCAVAVCGKIIFGNGTRVQLDRSVDLVVICLTVALGVCVVVIFALIFVITCKDKNMVRLEQDAVISKTLNQ
ncbi:putative immune-type receptor 15b precursor, partial [Clarias magur]